MTAGAIALIVVAIFVLFIAFAGIKIVPQARAGIVERLGRYSRTLDAGLALIVPFIDRVKPLIDLREQVVAFPPQPVITEDNLVVGIDTVIYFTVTDPKAATYEIANPLQAIEQLTVTTLRNVIGGLTLEETLTSRDNINSQLRVVLDEATGKWGIRVNRVELKSVEPPRTVQEAMEKQMRAERDRRAAILTAEGTKQSQILTAEGEKQAAVLKAEGARTAAILRAEGESKAIDTVFQAIHEGQPDQMLLSYQYLQMLPSLAQGSANKVFVIPSDFSQALGHISGALAPPPPPDDGPPPRKPRAKEGDSRPTRRRVRPRPTRRPPPAPRARPSRRRRAPRGRASSGWPRRSRRRHRRRTRTRRRPARPCTSSPSIVSGVFDSLAEKLQGTLAGVRQRGALTDDDLKAAMREIRLALLEADVNFKVVKQFTASVRERAEGVEVTRQLNPGQQVVKIVNEELTDLMGGQSAGLTFSPRPPTVILMAGLQGSGKTTATAKLARWLREERGSSVAVAACDVYRPAAVEQLIKVAGQAGATVYEQGTDRDPVDIAAWAVDQAKRDGKDVLIIDTSGRLHVDQALMEELARIRKVTRPHAVLLVVDAMTGQDAVNVAEQFAEVAQFDGVVLSKLDGDARGGAALSVKAVTGKPIMFASTGEKLGDFERFHPDRMAQRILGMGDVLSFIEKAERSIEEDDAKALEQKLRKNQFGLDDFLDQLTRIRKMGPLTSLLGMIPGLAGHQLSKLQVDEKEFDRIEAIIHSMTPYERRHPELIKGSRRLRIAKGSGTSVQQVNQLVKQFGEMRKVMKGMQSGKMPDLGQLMRNR